MAPRLTVYFTSDSHGSLFPTDFISPGPSPRGLYAMPFEKDGNTLVIDGGDTLQGSPLTAYCAQKGLPPPAAEALNALGCDYFTIGNHDFNYGKAYFGEYLRMSRGKCLCANVSAEGLPIFPWDLKVMENGLRVGLIGLCTEVLAEWESPENLKGVTVSPVMEAAQAAWEALKPLKPDVLIGVYHGGLEKNPVDGSPMPGSHGDQACALCEALPFDLLLTGHQHIAIPSAKWHGVHLVQPGVNACAYAVITLEEDGAVSSELRTPPPECPMTPARQALWQSLNEWLDTPISRMARPLTPGDRLEMALHGSDIADFFNLVQMDASGAQLSCAALANHVRGFGEAVTVRDVMASYPFPNTLAVRRVSGAVLRHALEKNAEYFVWKEDHAEISEKYISPVPMHFNYDFFAGISYALDPSKPVGSRVVELLYEGRPIAPEDHLTLCMNSYRSVGGGGCDFYRNCPLVKEIQTEMTDLILAYLRAHPLVDLPKEHPIRCAIPDKTEQVQEQK